MIKEILEKIGVQSKSMPRSLITLKTSSGLSCIWLRSHIVYFNRKITINKQTTKITDR
jgi:hypothetical protein